MNNLNEIVYSTCNVWLNNLVPLIFPLYIITDLLFNYQFIDILILILEKPFKKLFNLEGNNLIIFIFSLFGGFPSNARYIDLFLKDKLITNEDGEYLIKFTHFANPLFVINFIGLNILNNKKLGLFILISHYLSNFIIAYFIKGEHSNTITIQKKKENFGKVISKSINNTINSLFIILGNLIVFQIFIEIIFNYFNYSLLFKTIFALLIEITTGLSYLNVLNINIILKAFIVNIFLSFGGLAIHSQVYSILSNTNIKYKNYFYSRIIQSLISSVLFLIFLII